MTKPIPIAAVLLLSAGFSVPAPAQTQGQWVSIKGGDCKVWDPSSTAGIAVEWSGTCEGGFAAGQGVVQWSLNGKPLNRYEGRMSRGQANGKGTMVWTSGTRYEGDWVNDKEHGKGVKTWADGGRYEGDFANGKLQGKGKIVWKSGVTYEGDWVADKQTGKGIKVWTNGDRYEGDWVDNNEHGKGVYTWGKPCPTCESKYQGDFVNNVRSGMGEVWYADGNHYAGRFTNGRADGPAAPGVNKPAAASAVPVPAPAAPASMAPAAPVAQTAASALFLCRVGCPSSGGRARSSYISIRGAGRADAERLIQVQKLTEQTCGTPGVVSGYEIACTDQ